MEIPAIWFFSFWALISITFLHVGFYALDKTGLSNSVPPVVMSFFKLSLAVCTCCSSNYALMFHLQKKIYPYAMSRYWFSLYPVPFSSNKFVANIISLLHPLPHGLVTFFSMRLHFLPNMSILARWYFVIMTFLFLPGLWLPWYFLIFILINFILHGVFFINFIFVGGDDMMMIHKQKLSIAIHLAAEASLFFVTGENTKFFPILVLFVSFSISTFYTPCLLAFGRLWEDEIAGTGEEIFSFVKWGKEWVRLIEFAVGMVGAILFQNFFKLTSFNEVLAFLYLAVMWVSNLALLRVSNDCGVLNFLLGNMVVGTAVNHFELRIRTWCAFGASFLLYALRIKLESLTLVYEMQDLIPVDSRGRPRERFTANNISRSVRTPQTYVLDLLRIINTLIYDLEDLIKGHNPITDEKNQIKILHRGLIYLSSSIRRARLPQLSQIGELKETLMRIGLVAHEAKYLIISYKAGDVPHLYVIDKLTNINQKIELIRAELHEIAKKYEYGSFLINFLFESSSPYIGNCTLRNLRCVCVHSLKTVVHLPPAILTIRGLRYLEVCPGAIYDKHCNSCQTNNLEFLSGIIINSLKDDEMLECSPFLRKLKCNWSLFSSPENGKCRDLDLSFLTLLESVDVKSNGLAKLEEIRFSLNIRKLTLSFFMLSWEKMSIIGRLEKLEILKLEYCDSKGERWDTRDGEFQKLKFLKLSGPLHLTEWNVKSSQHFPMLQRLMLSDCLALQEIPSKIGEIPTLHMFEITGKCRKSMVESAKRIQGGQLKRAHWGDQPRRIIINPADIESGGSYHENDA